MIQMCYVGPKAKGMEYLQAISSWDGEKCLLNEVNEKSFLYQQDSIAQILRGKGAPRRRLPAPPPLTPAPARARSGAPVVHPLVAHPLAAGRGHPPDGAAVRRHAHRLQ